MNVCTFLFLKLAMFLKSLNTCRHMSFHVDWHVVSPFKLHERLCHLWKDVFSFCICLLLPFQIFLFLLLDDVLTVMLDLPSLFFSIFFFVDLSLFFKSLCGYIVGLYIYRELEIF